MVRVKEGEKGFLSLSVDSFPFELQNVMFLWPRRLYMYARDTWRAKRGEVTVFTSGVSWLYVNKERTRSEVP